VVVWLQDPETQASAASAVIAAATQNSQADLSLARGRSLEYRTGQFAWLDLVEWKRKYDNEAPRGVVFTDIEERRNRIEVGVADIAVLGQSQALVGKAGIPRDAIVTEIVKIPVPPLIDIDSLQGNVRPTVAGIVITRQDPGTKGCTLGANVVRVGAPGSEAHFITNSHCTKTMLGLDPPGPGSIWYQPVIFDTVATTEVVDPPPFAGGSCPSGRVCRWSDAALVRYTNASLWGGGIIALPPEGAPSPFEFVLGLVIDQMRPTPFGNGIYKVGASTGTSWGTRGRTCIRFDPDSATYHNQSGVIIPSNLTFLCQNTAYNLNVLFGDSGTPAFLWDFLPYPAKLMGLIAAGITPGEIFYSPTSGINKDLGTLKYDIQ